MVILSHYTRVEDAGRVAEQAGVKTLVLSHFVPAENPETTDRMWIEAARRRLDGNIVVGKDLLEIQASMSTPAGPDRPCSIRQSPGTSS